MSKQLKTAIYKLKRQYPTFVQLFTPDVTYTDSNSGHTEIELDSHSVKRALVLSEKVKQKFIYDISYIKANSNFASGGFFESSMRRIIIDKKDIPNSFEVNTKTFVKIGESDQKFNVVVSDIIGQDTALELIVKSSNNESITGSLTMLPNGTEQETIPVKRFVYQNMAEVYMADNSLVRPASGILVSKKGTQVYHSDRKTERELPISGTAGSGANFYLSTTGQATFDIPETGCIQILGHAFRNNNDGTYDVMVNIQPCIMYIESFDTTDFVADVLTVTHGLGEHISGWEIYDQNNELKELTPISVTDGELQFNFSNSSIQAGETWVIKVIN